jgi:hypothetical protein
VKVGDIQILDGAKVECKHIEIGTATMGMSFACVMNQSSSAVLNVVQQGKNSAEAFLGEFAESNANVNISNAMDLMLMQKCGGTPPIAGGSGACQTDIVQDVEVGNLTLVGQGSSLGGSTCDSLKIGCASANTTTSCLMDQIAKASTDMNQATENTAKGLDWISSLTTIIMIVAVAALIVFFLPLFIKRTIGAFDTTDRQIKLAKAQQELARAQMRQSAVDMASQAQAQRARPMSTGAS